MSKLQNINFSDENLSLDYLTLVIPKAKHHLVVIANFLHNEYQFNVNVYHVDTNKTMILFQNERFQHNIIFRHEKYSDSLIIQFPGKSSRKLFFLIKTSQFDLFQLNYPEIKLSRVDLNFLRTRKSNDTDIEEFFQKAKQSFQNSYPDTKCEPIKDENHQIKSLAFGDRKNSSYYLRIYKIDSNMKFELEIKRKSANRLGTYLCRDFRREFEHHASRTFLQYCSKNIFLETCYTDWLLYSIRPKSNKPQTYMVSSYFKKYFLRQTNLEEVQFYRLLQFVSFVRSCSDWTKEEILNGQSYITVQFKLTDFMRVVSAKENSYQRKQFLDFFDDLMGLPPFLFQFSDQEFRKLMFFPVVRAIQTKKRGPWIIKVAVAQPLLCNSYPFKFPTTFFHYSSSVNLQVKLSLIRAIAQEQSIQKTYFIQSFLNQYKNRNHSLQAQVKKELVQEFQNLIESKVIQPKFQVSVDGNHFIKKDTLQPEDLTKFKYIRFYEVIQLISKDY